MRPCCVRAVLPWISARQLAGRGRMIVALFLSDQRMPGMTGCGFSGNSALVHLSRMRKRVLLTAYADTEAAIRAINSQRKHSLLPE